MTANYRAEFVDWKNHKRKTIRGFWRLCKLLDNLEKLSPFFLSYEFDRLELFD